MERFAIGNDLMVEVIKQPMTTLTVGGIAELVQQAVPVTRRAFGNEGVTETDVLTHVIQVSTAVIVRDSHGQLIAFSTCIPESVEGNTIIHLKGTAVRPEFQGAGLYSILVPLRILVEAESHQNVKLLVGTRTQNPRVYEKAVGLGLFPRPDSPVPNWLKQTAEEYAALIREKHSDFRSQHGLEFDRETFVIRRAYGYTTQDGKEETFCLYGDSVPEAKDIRINQFLKKTLDFQNGDAILLIGPYSQDLCIKTLKEYVGSTKEIIERFSR